MVMATQQKLTYGPSDVSIQDMAILIQLAVETTQPRYGPEAPLNPGGEIPGFQPPGSDNGTSMTSWLFPPI